MATKEVVRSAFERAVRGPVDVSTIKTILVHIQDSTSAVERIESALSIARATSAHLTCLHTTPFQAYVAFDGFGGIFGMSDVMKAIDDEAMRLRQQVEKELRNEDVSWDYVHVTGNVTGEIIARASLADLIVTGREPRRNELGAPTISLLGDLLQSVRTPIFLPGRKPVDPTGPALVAWNGSFEAANAVRASLGLLKIASTVTVMHFEGRPQRNDGFPGTRLLESLSRQGVHAELVVETMKGPSDEMVAAGIVSHARSSGAYVIMGGYGHSRVREYLFGGVTRTMLGDADVPLVIGR
jgi:nucleotide-binding universal stress UspA family protein